MPQFTEQFDVVVVGAGHAGCEAAMAAARMGLKTALYTLNVDLIAQMSCNPAIGGIAKGHLVREVDALGGIMGEVTDAVGIQFRLLNTSRGPAVWSPRAQCDKQAYRLKMREVLESQPNLKIKQAEVADLIVEPCHPERSEAQPDTVPVIPSAVEGPGVFAGDQRPTANAFATRICRGLRLRDGRTVGASAIIITTGTFLNGLIHLPHRALRSPPFATGLLHRLDHAGNATHHPRKRASLSHVQRPDSIHRSTILPVDRRQDREVPRQDHASALPRTRRAEHARNLRQRYEHFVARRGSTRDSQVHPRP